MFQIIQQLQDKGVSRRNILYLNFFDDRLHNLRFPDPVALGVGTFHGVRLKFKEQLISRLRKSNPPYPPLSGGKPNKVPP
jgi:hypothetical protein